MFKGGPIGAALFRGAKSTKVMRMNIEHIAIITGVAQEADAFCADNRTEWTRLDSFDVRHVVIGETRVAIACSGVGKVNAATAATRLAAAYNPQLLMVIGTAGQISPIQGSCFLITEAVQNDFGAQRPDGFVHYRGGSWPMGPADRTPFRALDLPNCNLPRARIATGDAFVECPTHAADMAKMLQASLVDMETAAVAQASERLGLPWLAVKATTDAANGSSADDFAQNLAHAAHCAAAAAETIIRSGVRL